jgi:hypothetical protein
MPKKDFKTEFKKLLVGQNRKPLEIFDRIYMENRERTLQDSEYTFTFFSISFQACCILVVKFEPA